MIQSFNTDSKKAIRSNWAKPLLSFLKDDLEKKLVYLGLPGEQAIDIHEWLDFLDIVYAFECREHKKAFELNQSRDRIINLEKQGLSLNRRGLLSKFEVFDGHIEEVVLRGYDNSPTPKEFRQNDIITVYNLDFCNQVTSPIEFTDEDGNIKEAYKFDAVSRLLQNQRDVEPTSKKFLMFLTLHCSYSGKEFMNFQHSFKNEEFKTYVSKTNSLTKGRRAPYWVKLFVFNELLKKFNEYGFAAEFLPVIHYIGNDEEPLLCFTIFGTQEEVLKGVTSTDEQLKSYLNGKFVSVDLKGSFVNNTTLVAHNEKDWTSVNSLSLFKSSKTYKENWKNTR